MKKFFENIDFKLKRLKKPVYGLMFFICSLIIYGSLLSGCDVCDNTNEYKVEEGDIYFTAVPVNSNLPSIYRINADGKNLREVVKNGILTSRPTKDNKLVFLRENPDGQKVVVQSDIDGRNPKIIGDYSWSKQFNPIISPDGKYVAVMIGSKDLWIISNGTTYYKVSNKICENSMPVFSQDGTKLAFYEGYDFTGPLTVKTYSIVTNPPVLLSQSPVSQTGISSWKGEALIDWSVDGDNLTYLFSSSSASDMITISEWDNPGNSQSYEIPGFGAFQPSLSPDKTKLVFAGRDGNIWLRDLSASENKYLNLTGNSSQTVYNIYPQWSPDGRNVIYSKYFTDDLNIIHATLEIVSTDTDPPTVKVLSNNVLRGFWNRK